LNQQANILRELALTPTQFWVTIALFLASYILFLRTAINAAAAKKSKEDGGGWHVPTVDANAYDSSIIHSWDIRFKICGITFFCLFTAFLHRPAAAGFAFLFAFCAVIAAHLPLRRALRRLSAISSFLSLFLLVMPLTAATLPGDPLIIIGPYHLIFNLRALEKAAVIIIKACAVALMMEPLFNTAPFSVTIDGMRRLGLPSVICQMLLLSHRYIFVFLHEVKRMTTSMRLRGFKKRSDMETMRVMGNFVGMLLIRSVDRTERVYQAMLARGFQGSFPVYYDCEINWLDWLIFTVFSGCGLLLVIADHL